MDGQIKIEVEVQGQSWGTFEVQGCPPHPHKPWSSSSLLTNIREQFTCDSSINLQVHLLYGVQNGLFVSQSIPVEEYTQQLWNQLRSQSIETKRRRSFLSFTTAPAPFTGSRLTSLLIFSPLKLLVL